MKIFMNMNLTKDHSRALISRFDSDISSSEMFKRAWQARPKGHVLIPPDGSQDQTIMRNFRFLTAQKKWATENGLSPKSSIEDIGLAQIEESGAEVFYNHNWQLTSKTFLSRLPGCVRYKVAWHGAPSPNSLHLQYDLVLSNFPHLNQIYKKEGAKRVEYFTPSHDQEAEQYLSDDRPIDILFVGTFSRHHKNRALFLESIAPLSERYNLHMHLQNSRFTALAETPLGLIGPLNQVRRPASIRKIAKKPVFGHDLYKLIGQSKVVINMAINFAGPDRGNMRCFETLSCGAALVSDSGDYPNGFVDGQTFMSYDDIPGALEAIETLLSDPTRRKKISFNGHNMLKKQYSSEEQWKKFVNFL